MLNMIRKGNWLELVIPKLWEGITIEEIFQKEWAAPKKLTHFFRMENKVMINGSRANWNLPLPSKTRIQIKLFEEEEVSVIPSFLDVPILYEDDHVIIFNKPPFMNTHPNDPNMDNDTLINAAVFYLHSKGEFRNIHQIHRLDRDTTGAILFAKHSLAGAILDRMLENREIKRTYVAMVHGLFKQKKGTIRESIGRDRHHATKRRVSPSGQAAITHFHVIKEEKKKNVSFVKCWLDTGRTHQIRVHLSHLGHPLVGDTLYGGKPIVNRQALHAVKLEFPHPITKEQIVCHAPFLDHPPIFNDMDIYSI
ncbi:RluA family pseudouridine synthase [Neobacillus ginsengisoli]|uniref:Pseudouridine synthase n=1 Tax=Neobacillus ginsengisoli TaxID=904295 RepID=A0ABT9XRM0_9BACI|nr:RluA family pseudouridine synthase [Neobacillus ginsengisoli]MDQ0198043.1 23S rRNA pseudouridine1911/1915/1917 synthase [Neobacillus ginsengisoli]